ncbi:hypothetical protein [Paraburkholderia unamae]|uniref:hypothetical protein n=1 Tax=Paraburkholderia unamae TaxID=219649 RepID=UPI001C661034|nr:hypothetical protein [Paraburkholderia unamae]
MLAPPVLDASEAPLVPPAVLPFALPFAPAFALLPVPLAPEAACDEPPPFESAASCASSALISAFSLSMAAVVVELDDDEPPPPPPPPPLRSLWEVEELEVVPEVPLEPELLVDEASPVVVEVALLLAFDAAELLLAAVPAVVAATAVAEVVD